MPSVKTFSRKRVKTQGKRHGKNSMKKYGKTVKTTKKRNLRKLKGGDGPIEIIPGITISKPENIEEYEEIKKNMAEIIKDIDDAQKKTEIITKIDKMIINIPEEKKITEINEKCNQENPGDPCKENTKSSFFSRIFNTKKSDDEVSPAETLKNCNKKMNCKEDNVKIYYVYHEAISKYIITKKEIDNEIKTKLLELLDSYNNYKQRYLQVIGENEESTSFLNIRSIVTNYFPKNNPQAFLEDIKEV